MLISSCVSLRVARIACRISDVISSLPRFGLLPYLRADTFDAFIVENVGRIPFVNVVASEMTNVRFGCFHRRFFSGSGDEFSERFKLYGEWLETLATCESCICRLAVCVDLASIGSEPMPQKVCSFARNSNIGSPVSRHGRWEGLFWNCGNMSVILSNSKRDRASAIQLSSDDSHS